MKILEKYTIPGKYDTAEYGECCKVIGDNDKDVQYFIQLSHDKESANWIRVGEMLERVMKDNIESNDRTFKSYVAKF